MSKIKVDRISNRAGTGAPEFINGIKVVGLTSVANVVGGAATFTQLTTTGTITYEDVTNQDVIGLITARSGIKIGNDQDATGIGITLGTGDIGSASFAGIVTASEFSGDGSALTGLANTDFILAEQLTVIGFATVSDTFKVGTAITAHAGIITATSYYGDASNMDNAGISAGKSVGLAAFLGC